MSMFRTSVSWLGNDANAYLAMPFEWDALASTAVQREAVDTALAFAGQPPRYAKGCTYDFECNMNEEYCSAAHACHASLKK